MIDTLLESLSEVCENYWFAVFYWYCNRVDTRWQ